MGASAIGLSHVAVQFPVYEFLKRWLGERRQKERGEATMADRLSTVDLIVASSTSKVIGSISLPPAQLPAYQLAVCASVATVTPAQFSACPSSSACLCMCVAAGVYQTHLAVPSHILRQAHPALWVAWCLAQCLATP